MASDCGRCQLTDGVVDQIEENADDITSGPLFAVRFVDAA